MDWPQYNHAQLDFFAYASTTVLSAIILIILIYMAHTIFLPKISESLKLEQKLVLMFQLFK